MRYLSCLLLLCLTAQAAGVWRWRDAQGVIHYSDQPVPGAEQVSVQTGNTFSAPPAAARAGAAPADKPATVGYKTVEIVSPGNDATLVNTSTVSVSVRIEPALAPVHRVALYFDGHLVEGTSPQATSFTLNEVTRGEHSLSLAVLDSQGGRVASSAPVTFFVQQPSVLRK